MNQRLIDAAPEMRLALIWAVEALRATKVFMLNRGLDTSELNLIISVIDELLDRTEA